MEVKVRELLRKKPLADFNPDLVTLNNDLSKAREKLQEEYGLKLEKKEGVWTVLIEDEKDLANFIYYLLRRPFGREKAVVERVVTGGIEVSEYQRLVEELRRLEREKAKTEADKEKYFERATRLENELRKKEEEVAEVRKKVEQLQAEVEKCKRELSRQKLEAVLNEKLAELPEEKKKALIRELLAVMES